MAGFTTPDDKALNNGWTNADAIANIHPAPKPDLGITERDGEFNGADATPVADPTKQPTGDVPTQPEGMITADRGAL